MTMRAFFLLMFTVTAMMAADVPVTKNTPNILFIIADDASCHYGQSYNCSWAKTPHIDRLAANGLTFTNCFTPTSKCAPSRAAILTGRNPWQLEEAANHYCYFPAKYATFGEQLRAGGVTCGSVGKVWSPGVAEDASGKTRDWGMTALPRARNDKELGQGFAKFLAERPKDKPFFFWFGSLFPHRTYERDMGIKAGKKITDIDRVPAYWPDNEEVRRDMLDYAAEVEAFDVQVGILLAELSASGAGDNTIVIVTSDHGMPFPRVKGHPYFDAHHVPMVISWPAGIVAPKRTVSDYISFIDLAPTFLALQKVEPGPMAAITGHSFSDILANAPTRTRDHVIIGRERNDWGRPQLAGYPVRGIIRDDHLLLINYKADLWPCGNPEADYPDTDDSPTKQLLTKGRDNPAIQPFWELCFGKRPAEELFKLSNDSDCVRNLANLPEQQALKTKLKAALVESLIQQNDPRVLGNGDVFDRYVPAHKEWPGKFEAMGLK
jgi:N-sulfoglucosamine sulfohydrolase